MQAIILCGGRGERLMPLTARTPAPMLRINGKEVILYTAEQLEKYDVDKITLALGYGGKMIKDFFETAEYGEIPLEFSSCETAGTAPAVAYAADREESNIILIEGNCLFEEDLDNLVKFHKAKGAMCTALVHRKRSAESCICVGISESGEINGLSKDPSAEICGCEYCLTGIYVINTALFQEIPFTEGQDFTEDIIPALCEHGGLFAYEGNGSWQKILTPKGFLECQKNILYNSRNKIEKNTVSEFNGCTMIPPVYIGENVSVGTGTIIGKGTVIDDNAVIDSKCRIFGSYIGRGASLSEGAEINSAVVCSGASVGKSVKLAENSVAGERSTLENDCELCENAKVWADKTVKNGSVVRENLISGTASPDYIDDEGWFTVYNPALNFPYMLRLGMAVGTALDGSDSAAVGFSSKPHSQIMCRTLITGLISAGINVYDIGECTLPQLGSAAIFSSSRVGIYVELNTHCAAKIVNAGGIPIMRALERKIEKAFADGVFRTEKAENFGECFSFGGAKLNYEKYLSCQLPAGQKVFNAQIRCPDDISAQTADRVFRPVNYVNGERIVFHLSADAAKCSAYSESAGNVSWENLVGLCLAFRFENDIAVSVPYNFPSLADIVAENKNGRLYRYFNSPSDISDAAARSTALRGDNLFMRDGLALCAAVCSCLSEKNISLGEAMKEIPKLFTAQRYIPCEIESDKLISALCCKKAGIREGVVCENSSSRAVIRPLKNMSGLMIFAESFQSEQASSICDEISREIKKLGSHKL